MPYYAVRSGRNPGIYHDWDSCRDQVNGFSGARYKKFNSREEADAFICGSDSGIPSSNDDNSCGYSSSRSSSSGRGHRSKASSYGSWGSSGSSSSGYTGGNTLSSRSYSCGNNWETFSTSSSSGDSDRYEGGGVRKRHREEEEPARYYPQQKFRKYSTDTKGGGGARSKKMAEVFTDGACTNNGFGGARAGIGVYWGANHPSNVSERLSGRQTNNRAEIHAVAKACKQAREMGVTDLTVNTDSQFLINSVTKWMPGWKKKDWKLASGGPVKNKEDFQELEKQMQGIKVKWNHVRGHQGIVGNECADRLAVEGASKSDR